MDTFSNRWSSRCSTVQFSIDWRHRSSTLCGAYNETNLPYQDLELIQYTSSQEPIIFPHCKQQNKDHPLHLPLTVAYPCVPPSFVKRVTSEPHCRPETRNGQHDDEDTECVCVWWYSWELHVIKEVASFSCIEVWFLYSWYSSKCCLRSKAIFRSNHSVLGSRNLQWTNFSQVFPSTPREEKVL